MTLGFVGHGLMDSVAPESLMNLDIGRFEGSVFKDIDHEASDGLRSFCSAQFTLVNPTTFPVAHQEVYATLYLLA